jgi:2-methylisocitrate lyase-like PEP mutase family enzyme
MIHGHSNLAKAGDIGTTQEKKAHEFRALHESGTFVIPNPWDLGSARILEGMGFKALATTSSGLAFTLGRNDGKATLEEVAAHVGALTSSTELPVSVDLENGYGRDPESAAVAIERAAEAGAVGGSIEDYEHGSGFYSVDHAVERVTAAVEAARRLEFPFTLTARAENFARGNPDLDDTIARLQAYERAGADVIYAPCMESGDEIRSLCAALSKPVNVLARPGLSMRQLVDAGVRRISLGGSLTWVAAAAVVAAAKQIRDEGDFSVLAVPVEFKEWLG